MNGELSIIEADLLLADLTSAFDAAPDAYVRSERDGSRRWVVRGRSTVSIPPRKGLELRTLDDASMLTMQDSQGNKVVIVEQQTEQKVGEEIVLETSLNQLSIYPNLNLVRAFQVLMHRSETGEALITPLGAQAVRFSLSAIAADIMVGTTQLAEGTKRRYTADSYGRRIARVRAGRKR